MEIKVQNKMTNEKLGEKFKGAGARVIFPNKHEKK